MPIQEGDRIRIATGQEGRVELVSGGGTLAYVRLDGNRNGAKLSLYEFHALTRIEATDHEPVGPGLRLWDG